SNRPVGRNVFRANQHPTRARPVRRGSAGRGGSRGGWCAGPPCAMPPAGVAVQAFGILLANDMLSSWIRDYRHQGRAFGDVAADGALHAHDGIGFAGEG
nr:hypothetical protein [Tanacetum cinerariifolium]